MERDREPERIVWFWLFLYYMNGSVTTEHLNIEIWCWTAVHTLWKLQCHYRLFSVKFQIGWNFMLRRTLQRFKISVFFINVTHEYYEECFGMNDHFAVSIVAYSIYSFTTSLITPNNFFLNKLLCMLPLKPQCLRISALIETCELTYNLHYCQNWWEIN